MAGVLEVAGWQARDWDSAFFGVRIAQVTMDRCSAEELARAAGGADAAGIDCLYLLVDAADAGTVHAAEATGFSLIDIRLTLESVLAPAEREGGARGATPAGREALRSGATVRGARPDDLPRLVTLARANHRNTRFHQDRHFDAERSGALYATWIERSVAGELADHVWVVDVGGAAKGYLTIKADDAASSIGLVAVDPDFRGRGYGEALLRAACDWTVERGLPRVTVVTQGNSAAAIRFYQRAGFVASRVELWYHRWRTPSGVGGSHAAAR